jgi:hypothetical protein
VHNHSHHQQCHTNEDDDDDNNIKLENLDCTVNRRHVLSSAAAMGSLWMFSSHQTSWAGIDVSGLRVEGGGGGTAAAGTPNAALQQQLRAYDGSGTARIQQLQELKSSTSSSPSSGNNQQPLQEGTVDDLPFAATYAYRYNPGLQPQLKKVGLAGERCLYQDALALVTKSSSQPSGRKGYVKVVFEFPSDWLQLDRALGGIQYVDQRNGDKLIVLKAPIPDGESLVTVPKQWFANTVFDPKGAIVASAGIEVDDYKASKSTLLNDGSMSTSPHRRVLLKYETITPNGLRTERRGIVDAYEINNVAYMMFTGSNAVKFDKGGPERDTVERIVDSFVAEAIP